MRNALSSFISGSARSIHDWVDRKPKPSSRMRRRQQNWRSSWTHSRARKASAGPAGPWRATGRRQRPPPTGSSTAAAAESAKDRQALGEGGHEFLVGRFVRRLLFRRRHAQSALGVEHVFDMRTRYCSSIDSTCGRIFDNRTDESGRVLRRIGRCRRARAGRAECSDGSDPLDGERDALADADAHGGEAVAAALLPQFERRACRRCARRTCRADGRARWRRHSRLTMRRRRRQAELRAVTASAWLAKASFSSMTSKSPIVRPSRAQKLPRRRHRADAHDARRHAGGRPAEHARERLQAVLLRTPPPRRGAAPRRRH